MAIKYKFDVIDALRQAGYTSYKLRMDRLMSESTIQKLRNGEMVAMSNIDIVCRLLNCQPGDLLEYVEGE